MTTRSKYKAEQCLPRVHLTVKPESQMELLHDALLLGFGTTLLTLHKPNGETFECTVDLTGGINSLHNVTGTEQ